jgi:hypothetical protein
MKGYSEQRGVQLCVTFDAAAGCFAHTVLVHDFHARVKANPDRPPDAEVIELPVRNSKATSLSRKSRDAVTQILKMQSVG